MRAYVAREPSRVCAAFTAGLNATSLAGWVTAASQPERAQARVVVRPPAERPVKLARGRVDAHVVDARFAPPHEAGRIELPLHVAIRAEPLAGVVVTLVREAHRDAIRRARPHFLYEQVVDFTLSLDIDEG